MRTSLLWFAPPVIACLLATALVVNHATGQNPQASDEVAPSAPVTPSADSLAAEANGPPPPADSTADAHATAIQEIVRIRQQLGGLLKGTLLDAMGQKDGERPAAGKAAGQNGAAISNEFADSLRRVATETARLEPAPGPSSPAVTPPSNHCEDEYREWIEGQLADDADLLVTSLRGSSRLLDEEAADLEERQHYQRADQLRRLASQLRRTARQYAPHQR